MMPTNPAKIPENNKATGKDIKASGILNIKLYVLKAPTHINPAVPRESWPVNPVNIFKPTVARPTAKIGITWALKVYSEVVGTYKYKIRSPRMTIILSNLSGKISLSLK